ncbi:DNA (cytosine-5-)-methyltransferase [Clostridium estertheticum]|uniref:DNA (cytosine-5-)-methyltransferase n=1 Tax=Clostridium estertheticum TaxID=238834 RepID=UPI001C6E099D|nr:DNA (cytosine-5-)-methyltransferase [Clostridium estertheticum]MBW9154251.1 DNA cytosine methyltransferase [Clostridium estertheticum]WLC86680.1 DNA cytosine methyltransferase [Clostridium estertheticum]
MLKLRTLFSGIGSPESALKNIGIDYELVDFCEVDKYAIKSYCAVHGVPEDKNLGDVSKVWGRDLLYADLLVWGFPCTDISVAGKMSGIVEGETRSGLYYEGFRVLKETKPKYSIIENVKNLTGKKFKAEFEQMLNDIEGLGYNNYWQVLNAKNYGIPQNRERVFIVSIRKDVDTEKFEFPVGFDNGLRLKDFLESEVDEKYYISQEKTDKLLSQLKGSIGKGGLLQERNGTFGKTDVHSLDGYSPAITATCYKGPDMVAMPCIAASRGRNPINPSDRTPGNHVEQRLEINKTGNCNTLTTVQKDNYVLENKIMKLGKLNENRHSSAQNSVLSVEGICTTLDTMGGGNRQPKILAIGQISNEGSQAGKVYSPEGVFPTICACTHGYAIGNIFKEYRIRKLTPKECWRLMGFSDIEFQRAQDAGVSNSQLYKQAGNSIYTGCLSAIFKKLLQADIQANIEEDKILG